jgi:hypothetical protein
MAAPTGAPVAMGAVGAGLLAIAGLL